MRLSRVAISLSVLVCVHVVRSQDDGTRLMEMYENYGGDSWTRNDGWGDGQPCGSDDNEPWYGVICNDDGVITALDLSNNNLVGKFDFFGAQYASTYFNMEGVSLIFDNNHLSGELPVIAFPTPTRDVISLAGNELVSPIEHWNVYMAVNVVQKIDLSNNLFEEPLWGSSFNSYYKNVPSLNLANNSFYDVLPDVANASAGVTHLDLSGNNFEGPIPASWAALNLTTRAELNLDGMQFSCPYPEWVDAEALGLGECICDVRCESGGGTCGDDNVCECNTNFGCWSGPYCRQSEHCPVDAFDGNQCNRVDGRGQCADDGCSCACNAAAGDECTILKCPGFDDEDPEDFGCSADFDHGSCDTERGSCSCTDLWQGDACELSKCPQSGVRRIQDPNGEDGEEIDVHCSAHGKCFGETGHCFCDRGFLTNDCSLADVVAEAAPKSKTVPVIVSVGLALFAVGASFLVYKVHTKDQERYGSMVERLSDDLLQGEERSVLHESNGGNSSDYGATNHSRSPSVDDDHRSGDHQDAIGRSPFHTDTPLQTAS